MIKLASDIEYDRIQTRSLKIDFNLNVEKYNMHPMVKL